MLYKGIIKWFCNLLKIFWVHCAARAKLEIPRIELSQVVLRNALTDTPGERQPYRQSPILAYHEFFWLK